ncbi:MAG: mevalonate kinase [Deltaproteobacteria bacterium]|nr:mevalonate kinase [Deltaproteobacteria bacterium]
MTKVKHPAGARSCGKLILLGEHAVVHGVAAMACGIERGLVASLAIASSFETTLTLLDQRCSPRGDDALSRALVALLEAGSGPPGAALDLVVEGDLPPGMNLGFSAAAAVALGRALEAHRGVVDEDAVRARADAWERVFHGNPSGIDVAAAMRGGVVHYRRGEPVRDVAVGRPLRLCVGLSGAKPGPTRTMVERVAAIRERDPRTFERAIGAVAGLVARAESAIRCGELEALGETMNDNHRILAGWSLATTTLDHLCASARAAGALGAKLTGAGGGGAMVALAGAADDPHARPIATAILEAYRRVGGDGFEVVVGGHPD